MSNRLLVPDRQLVHGHGCVELFDDLTGKLRERVPFENFIASAGLRWQRRINRAAFWHAMPQSPGLQITNNFFTTGGGPSQEITWQQNEGLPLDPFRHIAVTDNADAEDSVNETNPKPTETVVGWANRTEYAGADTKRGTPNPVESIANSEFAKWVFDWPTHAANGTFRSVEWLHMHETELLGELPLLDMMASSRGSGSSGTSMTPSISASEGMHLNADEYWAILPTSSTSAGNRMARYLYATGAQQAVLTYADLGSFNPSHGQVDQATGDFWVHEYAFVSGAGDRVRRYTSTGTLVTDLTVTAVHADRWGLAWTGSRLFLKHQGTASGLTSVSEINPVTGALISTIVTDLPFSQSSGGLTYADGALWVHQGGTDGTLYKYSLAGTLLAKIKLDTVSNPDGGVWMLEDADSIFDRHFFHIDSSSFYSNGIPETLGARTRLGANVTKTSLQTMKVTYQFDFA